MTKVEQLDWSNLIPKGHKKPIPISFTKSKGNRQKLSNHKKKWVSPQAAAYLADMAYLDKVNDIMDRDV